MISNEALSVVRAVMSSMKVPTASDKVFKDECIFSFDSPFSDTGLYVNLVTLKGFGKDYLARDIQKGGRVYLHERWKQVPKEKATGTSVESNAIGTKEAADPPTKLAIGVSGGFVTEAEYDIVKENALTVVIDPTTQATESYPLPNSAVPEFVLNVVQGVIDHAGMKSNMQVSSWDADNEKFVSKYATDLVQLNPTGKKIPQDVKLWKDEATGATENLWLNLSTGYIGGGRKNWDGSGGSGSALQHYEDTGKQYPLAVKLGTITPHGADVWSYATDEDALVIDPKLSEHLSFWGIDIMKLEKTEKTLGEMEVTLNMSYDWSKIMDGQEQLEIVSGPGLVGLRNIGSSCYMSSVLQTICAIPEFQERYYAQHTNIVETAPADATQDFASQMSKVAVGVLSDRYAAPVADAAADGSKKEDTKVVSLGETAADASMLEKYVVAPRMFKHLVGQGHPEFSSGRQQDASEYFQFLLDVMSRAERTSLPRCTTATAATVQYNTASLFEFHVQTRYQCRVSGDVKYVKQGSQTLCNMLDLPVPLDKAVDDTNSSGGNVTTTATAATAAATGDEKDPESKRARTDEPADQQQQQQFIPFAACLEQWLQEEDVDMFSPSVGTRTTCAKTTKFSTFPRYLMLKVARYYAGPNWVQQKVTARIDVPEQLDLNALRGNGPLPDEKLMPEEAAEPSGSTAAAAAADGGQVAEFVINEAVVAQLVSMGFSDNGSRRAVIATNNADAEVAMNWVFAHMEDPDFNDPPVLPTSTSANSAAATAAGTTGGTGDSGGGSAGGGAAVNQEAMMMLTSMGYTTEQTEAALRATDNNIERAADWLFSHAEDLDAAVAEVTSNASQTSSAGGNNAAAAVLDDGDGKYTLVAIISHIGKNTEHGHYVCHIKKSGHWVLFNDEKVGKAKSAPLEHGFMYLYRRDDGPGTF